MNYIGIDVSKKTQDIHDGSHLTQVPNTSQGHQQLLSQIANGHFVLEASGGYEKAFIHAAHKAGRRVSIIHAIRIRQYARSAGKLAKTDPIDSQMIQRYAQHFQPAPDQPSSPNHLRLRELVEHRQNLSQQRDQDRNRLARIQESEIRRWIKRHIQQLGNAIRKTERSIRTLTATPEFEPRRTTLETVSGIGPTLSSMLIAWLPELGTMNRRTVAALVGVAPYNCESGAWKGIRRIQGGRAPLRKGLYMGALVAVRHNAAMKTFYKRLIEAGKPAKVALTAVMRKLVIHCNSLIKKSNLEPASEAP